MINGTSGRGVTKKITCYTQNNKNGVAENKKGEK